MGLVLGAGTADPGSAGNPLASGAGDTSGGNAEPALFRSTGATTGSARTVPVVIAATGGSAGARVGGLPVDGVPRGSPHPGIERRHSC